MTRDAGGRDAPRPRRGVGWLYAALGCAGVTLLAGCVGVGVLGWLLVRAPAPRRMLDVFADDHPVLIEIMGEDYALGWGWRGQISQDLGMGTGRCNIEVQVEGRVPGKLMASGTQQDRVWRMGAVRLVVFEGEGRLARWLFFWTGAGGRDAACLCGACGPEAPACP